MMGYSSDTAGAGAGGEGCGGVPGPPARRSSQSNFPGHQCGLCPGRNQGKLQRRSILSATM